MTESTSNHESGKRNTRRIVVRGCALFLALFLCAFVLNAVYWMNRVGVFAGAPNPAEVTSILPESLPSGNAADGEILFRGEAACSACHSLDPGDQIVGPSLAGIASRASTAKPDNTAEAYLLESIVSPDDHIVEGFNGGIMPPNFGQRLDRQQLADVIAFLMTQE